MREPIYGWVLFHVLILGMLALDLLVFNRRAHRIGMREALSWSAVWISLAGLFGVGVWLQRGPMLGLEFYTAYLIEYSLSVDNLFVFLLLFAYFQVPERLQHKVLFWGILGALVLRLSFILTGIALLGHFHWLVYVFGAVLAFSGFRMWSNKDVEVHPEANPALRLVRRFLAVTPDYRGERFFTVENARRFATPLFIVLLAVETTDVVFAVDSVPAVLAITRDPFVAYTSNAFAILGLRALFFALAGLMRRFHRLHYGLSAILIFVGAKMMISDWVVVPTPLSLGVVAAVLVGSVLASLIWPERESGTGAPER